MGLFKKDSNISPDRWAGMVRSVRTREHKHLHHKWPWVLLGIIVVIGAIAGYAFYLYNRTEDDIKVKVPQVKAPRNEIDPFNALLVGSDSRKGLTTKEQQSLKAGTVGVTGTNADTLIVAHVVPETDDVTMVQFPRDLWVPLPGGEKGRINSALAGGRGELVRTVQRITGLEINRYAEVNLAGFKDLIDAIGGVEVCVPEEIPFDSQTGIQVKDPGMVHFSGERALRFVRSRKVFATGDFARIQNQQRFLAAAIDKITSVDMILHLSRIHDLLSVAGRNLRVDDHTSPLDLLRLARRFQAFDPQHYEAYTAPNLGPGFVGDASVVIPNWPAINVMFRAIAQDKSPAEAVDAPNVEPGGIEVDVLNGTGQNNVAKRGARSLEKATQSVSGSVEIEEIDDAPRQNHKVTLVRYEGKSKLARKKARLVAAAIPGSKVRRGDIRVGVDVQVIVGRRFHTRRIVQIDRIPIPKPGKLPKVCREEA